MRNVPPNLFLSDPMGQILCASGALELALQRAGEHSPLSTGRRNAGGAAPSVQMRLRADVRTLAALLGYRPDFRGANPPWQVPWTPASVAAEVVRWLAGEAQRWIDDGSIYDNAKQPEFIRRYLQQMTDVAGRWSASAFVPALTSYEAAPAALVALVPALFAGQPAAAVLKAEPSWRFWYAAQTLAIHFDALAGAPTKLQIFGESLLDAVKELPDTLASAAGRAGSTIKSAVDGALPWKLIWWVGGSIASALLIPPIIRALREDD